MQNKLNKIVISFDLSGLNSAFKIASQLVQVKKKTNKYIKSEWVDKSITEITLNRVEPTQLLPRLMIVELKGILRVFQVGFQIDFMGGYNYI